MIKKYKWFNIFFVLYLVIAALLNKYGYANDYSFIKPVFTLSLLVVLFLNTKLKGRFHKRIFTGLIFAFIGDAVLLSITDIDHYSTYGLTAYLLCYIFYISAFYLDFKSAPELDKKGARIAISICAVLAMGFYFFLRPQIGVFKLPVMLYIMVVSMMTMMACFRNQRVNTTSFKIILAAVVFFILSDSILAYNKFVQPIDYTGIWTIITYIIAQYLITIGASERKLIHNN